MLRVLDLDVEREVKLILGDMELYPPQEAAIKAGILEDGRKNFLISSPTASGKTFLAELVMLKSILEENGKCLYVVPLNALAYEKYQNFSKYKSLVKVGISTGDYESSSRHLEKYDVTVLTLEKFDSLTRIKPFWLKKISALIVDEIHMIGDGKRGPRVEGAMARFKNFNPSARIIGLSATISNSEELAGWLDASLVKSEWRPVPLKEEVFLAEKDEKIVEMAVKAVKERFQVLIFINTKRGTASFSRKIAEWLKKVYGRREELEELADRVDIGVDDLADMVRYGVAYHNSWLHPEQRRAIEEGFRKRILSVICCTPTLAMGVSLPAKIALIRNYKFFSIGEGNVSMPVFWVKQVFGRAGRPEYDDYGIGMIVARSEEEKEEIERLYIRGLPERIESRFSTETMTEQILATIVGGATHKKEILEFIEGTFYSYQNRDEMEYLKEEMEDTLEALSEEDFICMEGGKVKATDFGTLSSRLYLSTESAIELREGIKEIGEIKEVSDFDLLLLLCKCEEIVPLKVRNAVEIASNLSNNLDWIYSGVYALGSAIMAHAWIEEMAYREMKERFGIYPGEVYNNIYVLEWISYAGARLAKYFRSDGIYARLSVLKERIKHGVKTDVLRLLSMKSVGRVIARKLYLAGLRSVKDVAKAEEGDLGKIQGIGKKRARKIKEEALRILRC